MSWEQEPAENRQVSWNREGAGRERVSQDLVSQGLHWLSQSQGEKTEPSPQGQERSSFQKAQKVTTESAAEPSRFTQNCQAHWANRPQGLILEMQG